jgi:signal transduction histidine kinase
VIVEDHGPGVPDEFVPVLFDRFSQPDSAKRHRQGAGLGLAKSFAKALGGDLRYELAEPSGARFHFDLPREPVALH